MFSAITPSPHTWSSIRLSSCTRSGFSERPSRIWAAHDSHRRWRHVRDGRMGAPAQAIWDSVAELRLPGALARAPFPRALDARQDSRGAPDPGRAGDRLGCALFDRGDVLRALALDIRLAMGALTIVGSRSTRRSTSLSTEASSRAVDPKRARKRTPRASSSERPRFRMASTTGIFLTASPITKRFQSAACHDTPLDAKDGAPGRPATRRWSRRAI